MWKAGRRVENPAGGSPAPAAAPKPAVRADPPPPEPQSRCRHRSELPIASEQCATCRGRVEVKVYACEAFGTCTLAGARLSGRGLCRGCPEYARAD